MRADSLKKYVNLRDSLLAEKAKLESRLNAINKALGNASAKVEADAPGKKRKKFSAAGRAAIAAAQRARWAKIRALKKGAK
ncbi:MAG TPA: hypothetical protein VF607_02200 [Verrucomicrobiae bacterium]